MNIKILPLANEDLLNGYYFYEQQKEGLGHYFLDSLFSDIDSLLIYAGTHQIFFNQYYRLLSKRFPFSVYYTIEEKIITIYAVLDCRNEPAWIKGRFK
jgi:hypothetical protein